MLIEAAKGGHTNVVNLLLDYPNNLVSPTPELLQAAAAQDPAAEVRLGRAHRSQKDPLKPEGRQICLSVRNDVEIPL